MWQPSDQGNESESKPVSTNLHQRSLWIALGVGTIYLIFGLRRTMMFLIVAGIAYACSHPNVRDRWIVPLWLNVLEWIQEWQSGKRR